MSNERWCGDAFEVACRDGVVLRVAFVLDCHDRERLTVVAVRRVLTRADIQALLREAVRASAGMTRSPVPRERLADNGASSTALPTVLVAGQLGPVSGAIGSACIRARAIAPRSPTNAKSWHDCDSRVHNIGARPDHSTGSRPTIPRRQADGRSIQK